MVVDDEPDILNIVERSLVRWGYLVDSFDDPEDALEHFKKNPSRYSLIITDIRMPKMSGAELARCAYETRPDMPVMIMTAFEVDKDLKSTLPSIDTKGFLQKPFHVADVCTAVKRLLVC